LAQCAGRLGNPDQQLTALQRAVEIDPQWQPARHGLAAALAGTGKLDAALAEYGKLTLQDPAQKVELGRVLLARTLRQPAAQRDWAGLNRLAAELAPEDKADTARLFRAEVLAAQEKFDAARALAEAERDRDPAQLGPWLFLAALAERQGRGEAV